MIFNEMTTDAILEEIGERVQQQRLERNLTQEQVWEESGCSRRAVQSLESGKGGSLQHFVQILRVLGKLDQLDALLPESEISPIQLLELKGKRRKRASKKAKKLSKNNSETDK